MVGAMKWKHWNETTAVSECFVVCALSNADPDETKYRKCRCFHMVATEEVISFYRMGYIQGDGGKKRRRRGADSSLCLMGLGKDIV